MKRSPEAFKRGDRVTLMLHYDFWGNPPPKGTVVGTSRRHVSCKMDRNGKVIRFLPQDLEHMKASAEGARRALTVRAFGAQMDQCAGPP